MTEQGIKTVLTGEESLGSKIAIGIENSQGEILSFLEDDDLFSKYKIENVLADMLEENVCYHHNSYSLIDVKGRSIKGSLPYVPRKNKQRMILDTSTLNKNTINKAFKSGGYFNLSCISIKKSIISDKVNALRNMKGAVDYFMFYLALDSGLRIIVDDSPLTAYRVHAGNNSLVADLNRRAFTSNKVKFFEDDMNGLLSILYAVKNIDIRNYLSCKILIPLLALSILEPGGSKIETNLRGALVCAFKIRSKELLVLVSHNSVSKVIKNFGNWLFFQYESGKMKKLYNNSQQNYDR